MLKPPITYQENIRAGDRSQVALLHPPFSKHLYMEGGGGVKYYAKYYGGGGGVSEWLLRKKLKGGKGIA